MAAATNPPASHAGSSSLSESHDVLTPDSKGRTALHKACQKGYINEVRAILEQHPTVNADELQDNMGGFSPLHLAAEQGHHHIIALLLESGTASVHSKVKIYGNTALHYAAMNGHQKLVETLVEKYNAYVDMPNKQGKTPLDLARANPNTQQVADYLESINTSFEASRRSRSNSTTIWGPDVLLYPSHLTSRSTNASAFGSGGSSVHSPAPVSAGDPFAGKLYLAGKRGDIAKLKKWADEGKNMNALTSRGAGFLHELLYANHADMVEKILEDYDDLGIDLNLLDMYGRNLVHLAVMHSLPDTTNALLLLGVDPNVKDHRGKTASWYAARQGDVKTFKTLECYLDMEIDTNKSALQQIERPSGMNEETKK